MLPEQWQRQVIERCHTRTGHAGLWRTLCAVREAYVWPGMQRSVKSYVQACGVCQIYKGTPQTTPYGRMPDPCYPHQIVSMDLTGPFARSERGHVYLFNLIDHLTGWVDSYPIGNKRAGTIADILQRDYFPRYGPPEVLISDRGLEFVNSDVEGLCKAWGVQRRMTTPYHPQSNAKVERFHRTLKVIIATLVSLNGSNWETQLGPALAAYRSTVSSATGYTPFQALYGRQMRIPLSEALSGSRASDNDDRVATLARVWQGAREALRHERERNEQQQRRKRLSGELQVGDSVIVLIPGMQRTFQPRWDARWQIMRERHPVYWIRHLPSGREKVLHRDKLRRVPSDTDWDSVPVEATDPLREEVGREQLQFTPAADRLIDLQSGENMDTQDEWPLPAGAEQAPPTAMATPTHSDTPAAVDMPPAQPAAVTPHRYPARKRRPPQYLEWDDWPSKRGRLAALDYYCYY